MASRSAKGSARTLKSTPRRKTPSPRAPAVETLSAEQLADMRGQLAAIKKAQAVIELGLDGTILTANDLFLDATGYTLDEICGRHHRMFCDPVYGASADYQAFWAKLGRGEYDAGQYKRVNKAGAELWLQASYNPIMDPDGRPFKVVKYATDITAQKLAHADTSGQLAAINKVQGVIEFTLDGRILNANDNFLDATQYTVDEVRGRHHRMFCDATVAESAAYRQFWEKLRRGEYDAGQYQRLRKDGSELWIQASYNPILDVNGRPYKVVKYATDITAQVQAARLLDKTVAQTRAAVEAAQIGDLTQFVVVDGTNGATAELSRGVNALLNTMAEMVAHIQEASGAVDRSAAEIAEGSEALAQRTEQQASALAEAAASIEELTATVVQNADNARAASKLAAGAQSVAEKGGSAVNEVVSVMRAITESSTKIADIIGVMDGIAFQTNVLALNAAVEAARAGEHGRGFAVVASEVRSLAQRSATAAKEIKALVSDSVERVGAGERLVADAGRTMSEIVGSVSRVTQIMTEIATASQEQSAGIEQVRQMVTQMDAVTQQNAALVEQTTSAAQALLHEASGLSESVGHYRVDAAQNTPAAHVVAATRAPQPPARARRSAGARA